MNWGRDLHMNAAAKEIMLQTSDRHKGGERGGGETTYWETVTHAGFWPEQILHHRAGCM